MVGKGVVLSVLASAAIVEGDIPRITRETVHITSGGPIDTRGVLIWKEGDIYRGTIS
jgi:hypothetical protein